MLYWIFYISMLVGYLGLSILSSDLKTKVIGVLLTLVNTIIFGEQDNEVVGI